ncbi:PaaI family thioesterase [Parasegetibacter sp. NRK P23]|uniref:PaaI family thioesterase n=1 Tax=Parasegetibacter sp. NRK P23 TaxID=2942999 RepID=UPI0020438C17|nr:hotdog fold thioesterase [Parasegetibacter sp. NRK P23]MCM5527773.1 hotdog fold thioesterase [Parasegetibacter sp. NRK P23]
MTATEIINAMMEKDAFSQWMHLERLEESAGSCTLQMKVAPSMCNGFGVAHGGTLYSFADSCVAFAVNALGEVAVSVETSISHLLPAKPGDVLTCTSNEERVSARMAVYTATITNEANQKVALFKGVYFRTGKSW